MKTSEELLTEAQKIVTDVVEENLASDDFEWPRLKQEVRDALSRYLFDKQNDRQSILSDELWKLLTIRNNWI